MARHLDMDLLRALVATAEAASFSLAATRLGRTQSAISLQIKRLEEQVGKPLLVRSQGRLEGVTEEGLLLLDYARRILRLNDEAIGCFSEADLAGSLRVGLAEEVMERDLGSVVAEFHSAYPRVKLALECDLSARLAARVEAGELDMALIKRIGERPTHAIAHDHQNIHALARAEIEHVHGIETSPRLQHDRVSGKDRRERGPKRGTVHQRRHGKSHERGRFAYAIDDFLGRRDRTLAREKTAAAE